MNIFSIAAFAESTILKIMEHSGITVMEGDRYARLLSVK